MPKKFDEILSSIKKSLTGTVNPRTKKKYTNSEIFAVAVSQYKKKFGKAPSKESSPNWYCENGKEIRENVNLKWNEVIEVDSSKKSDFNTPLKIKGMAINETITGNGIKYIAEELESAAPTLINKPLLNSHNHDDVKAALGKVVNAYKIDGGIVYEAEIDPEETVVVNKVKRGYINKVSICGSVKKLVREEVEESDGSISTHYVAKGLDLEELSLVTVPGDANSSISVMHAITECFDGGRASLPEEIIKKKNINGDIKMSEELKTLQESIESLKDENKKLLDSLKLKEEAEKKEEEEAKEEEEKAEEALRIDKLVAEKLEAALKIKEDEAEKEKEKEDEKAKEDLSKGLVGDSKSAEKVDINEVKNMVVEKNRDGTMFYRMPKEATRGDFR